jgi:hypothetical protein
LYGFIEAEFLMSIYLLFVSILLLLLELRSLYGIFLFFLPINKDEIVQVLEEQFNFKNALTKSIIYLLLSFLLYSSSFVMGTLSGIMLSGTAMLYLFHHISITVDQQEYADISLSSNDNNF